MSPLPTPHPLLIAHRGGVADTELVESTAAAYTRALAAGVDGLECDVRLTADGVVLIHHDPVLVGHTRRVGLVRTHTLAELQAASEHTLLTLPELLALWEQHPPTRLYIELKHPGGGMRLAEAILALVADHPRAEWITVMSFSASLLHALRRGSPHLRILRLYRPHFRGLEARAQRDCDTGLAAPILLARPELVSSLRRYGREVYAYTCNDAVEFHRLGAIGVRAVTSDYVRREDLPHTPTPALPAR